MARQSLRRFDRLAKPVATLAVGGGLVCLLSTRLGHLDPSAIGSAVAGLGLHQWALALLAVTASFLAVGGQERVLHRHLGLPTGGGAAFRAGMAAGAISQTVGFGPLTGAFVRWRLLPGLTLWQATRIATALTVGFLFSLALLASVVMVTLHETRFTTAAEAVLLVAVALLVCAALRPSWLPKAHLWPNAVTVLSFLFWAVVDLVALSAALWLLFPAGHAPAFATLLPIVLLALGAGLASGAPAGVGAFEMVLILFLPGTEEAALMAAVVAWRIAFYALPAGLGMLWTAFAARSRAHEADAPPMPVLPLQAPPSFAPRAEVGLARQGSLMVDRLGPDLWLTGRTPHVRVALFEPFGADGQNRPPRPDAVPLDHLRAAARAENRFAALYKCDARMAALARDHGYRTLRIAREAVIAPATFDLSRPAMASLRRKLRKAQAAGVTVVQGHDPHCPDLARINAEWTGHHGQERGFSMGRFCPHYLGGQRLFVAWLGGRPIAFASFHATAREWTLDLMRHGTDLPDGTMQALVASTIEAAAARGLPRLSLAAVPDLPPRLSRLWGVRESGLARFKQGFAPRWEPRYLAAPGALSLFLAGVEIARAVHRPDPLHAQANAAPAPFHEQDADYEFATVPTSWQRGG